MEKNLLFAIHIIIANRAHVFRTLTSPYPANIYAYTGNCDDVISGFIKNAYNSLANSGEFDHDETNGNTSKFPVRKECHQLHKLGWLFILSHRPMTSSQC